MVTPILLTMTATPRNSTIQPPLHSLASTHEGRRRGCIDTVRSALFRYRSQHSTEAFPWCPNARPQNSKILSGLRYPAKSHRQNNYISAINAMKKTTNIICNNLLHQGLSRNNGACRPVDVWCLEDCHRLPNYGTCAVRQLPVWIGLQRS